MAMSILLVEDDNMSRTAMTNLLKEHGFDVIAVDSHDAACDAVGRAPIDAAIVDLRLPGLSGDSFGAFLKARYPKIRIIFVSGEYSMLTPERFGPQTVFLHKPVAIDLLIKTLTSPVDDATLPV